jgi:hypothetical protein
MHTCALCVIFILIDVTGKHNFCVFHLNKQFAKSCLFTGVFAQLRNNPK